jgi:hypothetical protein
MQQARQDEKHEECRSHRRNNLRDTTTTTPDVMRSGVSGQPPGNQVLALGRADTHSVLSYLRGQVVPNGTPGSVRLDAVVGDPGSPEAIFDLKTGSAHLSEQRIAQVRSLLPTEMRDIPIVELRAR